jgi:flavin reductase (DIM6/NTAB) family NADH-FMN oxidoreductase RutF
MPVDLRETLSRVPTPVTVVTTLHDGLPHGTTVSAFCSLSAEPPLVLIALDGGSVLLEKLPMKRTFGISVLAHDQSHVALACASKRPDKFNDLEWRDEDGAPRLEGTAGWFRCLVEELLPGGDHTIVIGRVVDHDFSTVSPLVYHRRAFTVPS